MADFWQINPIKLKNIIAVYRKRGRTKEEKKL
jgi:hypothetical protein